MTTCPACGLTHDGIVELVRAAMRAELAEALPRELDAAIERRWPRRSKASIQDPVVQWDGLVSLSAAKRIAGCGSGTLYRAVKRGHLRAEFTPGAGDAPGRWSLDPVEVRSWAASRRHQRANPDAAGR